jgi:hypothetical protein
MRDEVPVLFREVADLAPQERQQYFERHRVPAELRAEVESLLSFDSPDAPLADLMPEKRKPFSNRGRRLRKGSGARHTP